MPELDPSDPHRASAGVRFHPSLPPKPYTYQGHGFDLFDASAVPESCTCTWSWGPPAFRWVRIGVKEDCPWHRAGDTLMARVRQP